jgi:ABC-2 type transport system permease protein
MRTIGFPRGLLALTWLEIKIFLREPLGVIGSVFVPVFLFTILSRMFGARLTEAPEGYKGIVGPDLAVFAALLIGISAVLSLVTIVAIYRESGILKRLRATPLRPLTILSAHVLVKLLFTAATLVLTLLMGRRYFAVDVPIPWVAFTAATAVSTLSILSLGFVLAGVAPTARFAQPIGTIVLYPMVGFSGLFVPVNQMPIPLQLLAHVTPGTYAVSLMRAAWRHESLQSHAGDLLGLAVIAIVCTVLAVKVFRWE